MCIKAPQRSAQALQKKPRRKTAGSLLQVSTASSAFSEATSTVGVNTLSAPSALLQCAAQLSAAVCFGKLSQLLGARTRSLMRTQTLLLGVQCCAEAATLTSVCAWLVMTVPRCTYLLCKADWPSHSLIILLQISTKGCHCVTVGMSLLGRLWRSFLLKMLCCG